MKTHAPISAVCATIIGLWLTPPVWSQPITLWVSPNGSNQHSGSPTSPFASLPFALENGGRWHDPTIATASNSLRIVLRDGIYPLTESLQLKPDHLPPVFRTIIIEAAPGEHPVLSGGVPVGPWSKLSSPVPGLPEIAKGKVWRADAPRVGGKTLEFRQLWVNDTKAIRARTPNGDNLFRLVAWDKARQTATIPDAALAGVKKPAGLEMIIDQVWEIAVLRVQSIRHQGTNTLVTFRQPESRIEFEHPWPPVIVNTNYQAPFFLANAIQFLDSPGEWYLDSHGGKIYYWPREGEDMAAATVFAPALETLVEIEGALENPIANVSFKGITFAHTTWLRPSLQGHVPLQAGMFLLDAKKLSPKGTAYHSGLDNLAWIGRPPAAVQVKNANHITFENCTFEHLASAGLDFASGTRDDLIQGCTFRDLGGNGLQIGKFSDATVETHIPWNPVDERESCTRETIANNLITDCGNEDWGCVGIAAGYVRDVSIRHNEVFNLPYTGISVGWGWTKQTNAMRGNLIEANRIHHVATRLGDTAGIYTLSAQPGTVIRENYVHDLTISAYVPDTNHWFYLYLDEGSSGITVRDNWCPSEKFLKNANGPGNVWTNNGPMVSETIKTSAGLEPAFQPLFK